MDAADQHDAIHADDPIAVIFLWVRRKGKRNLIDLLRGRLEENLFLQALACHLQLLVKSKSRKITGRR